MTDDSRHINWEVAARLLSGEADEIDQGLLKGWLAQGQESRDEWAAMHKAWTQGEEALLFKHVDTDSAWKRVRSETIAASVVVPRSIALRYKVMGVAALLVAVLGVVWFFAQPSSSLIVSNAEREEVLLSDGSSVTLNAGSTLKCVQPFKGHERKVELRGEGFFKVEHKGDQPFVVGAGGLAVRVVGTRFNVRAYPSLNLIEVTVVSGKVEVMPLDQSRKKVSLSTGQMALFHREKGTLTVQKASDPNLLAWITRKMQFRETALGDVLETIERVYRVDIQVDDPSIKDKKLTAQFSDHSLDFVLNVVCMTFNLKMDREGDVVVLSQK